MRCLYIDTTSNYLYTGIVEKESLLCERKIRFDKDLSTIDIVTQVDNGVKEIDDAYQKLTAADKEIAEQDAIISTEKDKQATAKDIAEQGIRRQGGWWHALTL